MAYLANRFTDYPWRYWAKHKPQHIALWHEDKAINWQQLTDCISQVAVVFQQQGVDEGNSVALLGKNSFDFLIAYLAVLSCGARLLPVNPKLPKTQIGMLLDEFDITFVCDMEGCLWPRHMLYVQHADNCANFVPTAFHGLRPATMTLTSASTGTPKAAVHHINAHLDNADGVLAAMHYRENDCWLLSLPLFHVSGQGIVWRWLSAGAQMALRTSLPLGFALRGCTHASLVPTQLLRLLEDSLGNLILKEVLLGGAMIQVDLVQRAEQAGITCWCGYGLTEMASTVCAKRADALPGVGNALPGREIKIVDEEIRLRGAGMAMGYWRNGGISPFTDNEGWLRTRDRGVFENGELRVLGRLDHLFFSGGEGIQPENIECVLQQHPAVRQAIVVPVHDAEFGQRPVAVLEKNDTVSFDEICAWLQDKLARFQQPVCYYELPDSLKNGAIKIPRHAIQEWVNQKHVPQ